MKFSFLLSLLIVLLLIFVSSFTLYSQDLSSLNQEREKHLKEIEYLNKLLKSTETNEKISLNNIKIIDKKIGLQQQVILNIELEIKELNKKIVQNRAEADSLGRNIEKEKEKYAKMIVYIQKKKYENSELMFLLSSKNFNQAYQRLNYIKQYSAHRKNQAEKIKKLKDEIENNIAKYNVILENKTDLYNQKESEMQNIEKEKHTQKTQYAQLQKKEKEIVQQIKNKRKTIKKLQDEIAKLIAEENKRKQSLTASDKVKLDNLTAEFQKKKGQLSWPTTRGVITEKFGEYYHPVMKGVKMKNYGIDITTQPHTNALAIYNGVISKVLVIAGANKTVIIRHGDYLSVYSNLNKVYVKQGETVSTGNMVGQIYTDKTENNQTILQLQIYKDKIPLNPEHWLIKR